MALTDEEAKKLLALKNANAAYLYIALHNGQKLTQARTALGMMPEEFTLAVDMLKQFGMLPSPSMGEKPGYSTETIRNEMSDKGSEFPVIVNLVQRYLGRVLNTEELRSLLNIVNHLGYDLEMVEELVKYCVAERRMQNGKAPSLRYIEKVAYKWAGDDLNLSSAEEIRDYVAAKEYRNSRIGQIKEAMQIRGRDLTVAEEKLFAEWISYGYSDKDIQSAYETAIRNTGNANLSYINKVMETNRLRGKSSTKNLSRSPGPIMGCGEFGSAELDAIAAALSTPI